MSYAQFICSRIATMDEQIKINIIRIAKIPAAAEKVIKEQSLPYSES